MYKTDKPLGFAHKDILWVYQNIKGDIVQLPDDGILSVYKQITKKRNKIFVIDSIDSYSLLTSSYSKLRGKFILLGTEEELQRAGAILLDKDNISVDNTAFFNTALTHVVPKSKIKESYFKKESKHVIHLLSNRVMNQSKVFKKTYQTIHAELISLVKKKTTPQKFNRYKNYISELLVRVVTNNLPYSEILNIKLGDSIIINKEGHRNVMHWCESPSSIRTIQTFHDIILNHTPKEKALLENYGDAFSLNMMLEAWHPKSATFKENYNKQLYKGLHLVSKDSLISKKLIKRRNKTDTVAKNMKHVLYVKKGIMKVDNLIKKLKLPEDEYRVVGNIVKDGKVNIVKEGISLHGIHSNKVFSVIGIQ